MYSLCKWSLDYVSTLLKCSIFIGSSFHFVDAYVCIHSIIGTGKMIHLSSVHCQDVPSLGSSFHFVYVCECVLCSRVYSFDHWYWQDDPSFVSTLSRCSIFGQFTSLCATVTTTIISSSPNHFVVCN